MLGPVSLRWFNSRQNYRRGFSLLEVTIALSISGLLFSSLWQLTGVAGQNREAAALINKTMIVTAAAQSYIRGQGNTLLALSQLSTLNSVARIKITSADTGHTANSVQEAGYLPSDFTNTNTYGQSYALFVRREDGGNMGVVDSGDNLVGLLVSTGGQSISDALGAKISGGMGAPGGFMFRDSNPTPPASATTVLGSAGGWSLDLTSTGWSNIGSIAKAGYVAALVSLTPSAGIAAAPPRRQALDDLDDGVTNYTSYYNVMAGYSSGAALISSAYTTAFGYSALSALSTGNYNTAFGARALSVLNTVSNGNTGIGYNVMANVSGFNARNYNTAIGTEALSSVGGETGNTAAGYRAMYYGYGRSYNTAIGAYALQGSNSAGANLGQYNTVIGRASMSGTYRQQGSYNTVLGANIMTNYNMDYAGANTALGYEALSSLTGLTTALGQGNTALGYRAGNNISTGNYNLMIGANANPRAVTNSSELNIGDLIYYGPVTSGGSTASIFTIGQTTGNPFASLDLSNRTDGVRLARGTTVQRPTCDANMIGTQRWENTFGTQEFCNGTDWVQIVFDYSSPTPSVPPTVGYFVMTRDEWDGNLGGIAGANAKCLSDLTNYNWMGRADALANSQLTAAKVYAFICRGTGGYSGACNKLQANTTYYFARSGNPAAGGASFTTDASGFGPDNLLSWGAGNYFNSAQEFWSNRTSTSSSKWGDGDIAWASWGGNACNTWTTNSSATFAAYGAPANTSTNRWATGGYGFGRTCNQKLRLVCFVNP